MCDPGGSCNNDRTDASGVWNHIAATALYSPSPQNNYKTNNFMLSTMRNNKQNNINLLPEEDTLLDLPPTDDNH